MRLGIMQSTSEVIQIASKHLLGLKGHSLDLLNVSEPISPAAAVHLAKVISKLSPMLGNLIEFNLVEYLNQQKEFAQVGVWRRQDPGFPDAIFESKSITPQAGFEIKAWFPLATEITARFKDSQKHFEHDQTYVVFLAWLPEHLIFGKPYVLDLCIVSGRSVAEARDKHYHNPPDYLVVEPNDTSARTSNLQQTNTNGYKWQGSASELVEAKKLIAGWGADGRSYSTRDDYQKKIRDLMSRYPYRLDTNFAKTDRIVHPELEAFKTRILKTVSHKMTLKQWAKTLSGATDAVLEKELREKVGVKWKPLATN